MIAMEQNWSKNYTYSALAVVRPPNVDALQAYIRNDGPVRALGSRHSFNHVADSAGVLISLEHMQRVLEIDRAARTVTAEGGITYGQLAPQLHEAGFALPNLASLPHISVVGACATGSHGSGEGNGNLATSIRALEIVTYTGEIIQRSRDTHPDEFNAWPVHLGALGIVTKVTLDIVPTFDIVQTVHLGLPFEAAIEHLDEIEASAYSVSLFTKWDGDGFEQVWRKQRASEARIEDDFFGATLATEPLHPVGGDPEACTVQLGEAGPWHERLPHFKMEFTPSHGEEIQTEYFVPREEGAKAIRALRRISKRIAPLLYTSEVRAIQGDDLWLSPHHGRDSIGFHFTWKPDAEAIRGVLPHIETVLESYGARPHWGKVFRMPPHRVRRLYPRMKDFAKLMKELDPHGKFRNDFLTHYVLGKR